MESYIKIFQKNRITGRSLLKLNKKDLQEIGILDNIQEIYQHITEIQRINKRNKIFEVMQHLNLISEELNVN